MRLMAERGLWWGAGTRRLVLRVWLVLMIFFGAGMVAALPAVEIKVAGCTRRETRWGVLIAVGEGMRAFAKAGSKRATQQGKDGDEVEVAHGAEISRVVAGACAQRLLHMATAQVLWRSDEMGLKIAFDGVCMATPFMQLHFATCLCKTRAVVLAF